MHFKEYAIVFFTKNALDISCTFAVSCLTICRFFISLLPMLILAIGLT
jgi:hypothetical protein